MVTYGDLLPRLEAAHEAEFQPPSELDLVLRAVRSGPSHLRVRKDERHLAHELQAIIQSVLGGLAGKERAALKLCLPFGRCVTAEAIAQSLGLHLENFKKAPESRPRI